MQFLQEFDSATDRVRPGALGSRHAASPDACDGGVEGVERWKTRSGRHLAGEGRIRAGTRFCRHRARAGIHRAFHRRAAAEDRSRGANQFRKMAPYETLRLYGRGVWPIHARLNFGALCNMTRLRSVDRAAAAMPGSSVQDTSLSHRNRQAASS